MLEIRFAQVSLVVGLLVALCRFLPQTKVASQAGAASVNRFLVLLALTVPFAGFLATLPTEGLFFAAGQQLGCGFLIGGLMALLTGVPTARATVPLREMVVQAAAYGGAVAAVAAAFLLLKWSNLDGLMGVGIGWFCVTFPLLLALPAEARSGPQGRILVLGIAMAAALCAAATIAQMRGPQWTGITIAFAALGSLVTAGMGLFPGSYTGARKILPLGLLVTFSGLALFQMENRTLSDPRLLYLGLGGLISWPVALAVLGDALARQRALNPGSRVFIVPPLAILTLTAGAMAAIQNLQSMGIALFTVGLLLSVPATAALLPTPGEADSEGVPAGEADSPGAGVVSVAMAVFAVTLLLWRLWAARWTEDLRGLTLSDQYALFGLLLGATAPVMLAGLPDRWRGGSGAALSGLLTLMGTTLATLAVPGAALLLFGPKSVATLLIGLGLGSVLAPGDRRSLLPGTLALGIGLAVTQFGGKLLPLLDLTRATKLTWLTGIFLVAAVIVFLAERQKDVDTSLELPER